MRFSSAATARPSPLLLGRRSGEVPRKPIIARAVAPTSQAAAPSLAAPTTTTPKTTTTTKPTTRTTTTTTTATVGVRPAPPAKFEPRADPSASTGALLVLAVVGATAAYWWQGVVPSARRSLAADKRRGGGAQYLERLQRDAANGGRKGEAWFYTDWLRALERRQDMAKRGEARRRQAAGGGGEAAAAVSAAVGAAAEGGAASSSSLLSPSESRLSSSQGGRPEVEDDGFSVPPDREPLFWSLDNPIVATGALVAVGSAVAVAARALGQA